MSSSAREFPTDRYAIDVRKESVIDYVMTPCKISRNCEMYYFDVGEASGFHCMSVTDLRPTVVVLTDPKSSSTAVATELRRLIAHIEEHGLGSVNTEY